jgi:hypothetical protein
VHGHKMKGIQRSLFWWALVVTPLQTSPMDNPVIPHAYVHCDESFRPIPSITATSPVCHIAQSLSQFPHLHPPPAFHAPVSATFPPIRPVANVRKKLVLQTMRNLSPQDHQISSPVESSGTYVWLPALAQSLTRPPSPTDVTESSGNLRPPRAPHRMKNFQFHPLDVEPVEDTQLRYLCEAGPQRK